MVNIAKRVSRYFSKLRGRVRSARPKTFKTEEAANKWAKEQGFTDYKLKNLKSTESSEKKIQVIIEI